MSLLERHSPRSNCSAHVGLIVLIYSICFGAYNFVNVPFWDDWVLLQYGVDGLWELFKQIGRREHYLIIAPLVAIGQPMVWAALSFICWGVVALCIYFFLHSIGWPRANAFWASALTAAMPLNQARFALAMTSYSVCAAFFAAGMLVLIAAVRRDKFSLRIWAALLLTASFTTNSFLAMSWLAPASIFFLVRSRDDRKRLWPAIWGTLKYVEFFVLPLVYWISKSLFQPVYGLYADYNTFKMGPVAAIAKSAISLVKQIPYWADFYTFFPDGSFFAEALVIAFVVIIGLIAVIQLLGVEVQIDQAGHAERWFLVAALTGAAITALFPYTIVGLYPDYHALWATRHQTTLAMVAGALTFAFIRAALPPRAVPAVCIAVLICCVTIGVSASRQLLADVYDSNAIINSPAIASIEDGTMVGVFENNRPYRMFQRHFQYYELSGMLNAHSDKKTLVGVSNYEVIDPFTGTYVAPGSMAFSEVVVARCLLTVGRPQYGFGDVVSNGQFAEVILQPKYPPPSLLTSLAIAVGFLFDRQATVDRAVAGLDVQIKIRAVDGRNCGHPPSN